MHPYFPYFLQFPLCNGPFYRLDLTPHEFLSQINAENIENSSTRGPVATGNDNPDLPLSRGDLTGRGYEVTKRPWSEE